MSVMTPPDKKSKPGQPAQPKKTARKGASVTIWLPQALKDALDAYVDASRPKTNGKAVIEAALEDFLTKEGHWPPADTTKP